MKTRDSIPSVPTAEPTGISDAGVQAITDQLSLLLADDFTLYLKTKSFHWHVVSLRFYEMHLLFDSQAEQIFAMTDDVAERARKIGGVTLRSIGDVARHRRLTDNDEINQTSERMVTELLDDNRKFAGFLRAAHGVTNRYRDLATTSLIENWIDQTERRVWILSATVTV